MDSSGVESRVPRRGGHSCGGSAAAEAALAHGLVPREALPRCLPGLSQLRPSRASVTPTLLLAIWLFTKLEAMATAAGSAGRGKKLFLMNERTAFIQLAWL
jgi:hypothetical protein